MRILHCCLAAFYCEGYNYQENVLPRMNKLAGHAVEIIASTEKFLEDGKWGTVAPGRTVNEDGIPVVRLPYSGILPRKIMEKVRLYRGLYDEIAEFGPEAIFHHGTGSLDLLTIKKYVKSHPNVLLYVDSHGDKYNSGKNLLSRLVLHKGLCRAVTKSTMKYVDRYLYLTYECKEFMKEMYKIPEEKLTYYPLGGIIFSDAERLRHRSAKRLELKAADDELLCIHSGKLDSGKKTKELLLAFKTVANPKIKLAIIGTVSREYEPEIMPLISGDPNVLYLGWKTGTELQEYLCAGDLYIQPGGQSATMQNALCCGCAVAVTSVKAHTFLLGNSAFYIDSIKDISDLLNSLSEDRVRLEDMRQRSMKIAKEKLDYEKLANKIVTGFDE